MDHSYYLGPKHRPLALNTWGDVVAAAKAGVLDETAWVELKKDIPASSPASNTETAKDLASLSVDGGLLVVGIEDAKGKAGKVTGTNLQGLADRLSQVAVMRVDPPLTITSQAILHPDDPDRGVLLVTVPASLSAPHMVEASYWGRSDVGKRKLGDSDVRRLVFERERRTAEFTEQLHTLPSTLSPINPSARRLAHAHLLLRPQSAGSGVSLVDVLEERNKHAVDIVVNAISFEGQYSPTIDGLRFSVPNPEGYELTTQTTVEEDALRVILAEDGTIKVFSGRASYRTNLPDGSSGQFISPGGAVELAHSAIRLAGSIGTSYLGYAGPWTIGILIDGLQGLRSTLALSSRHTRLTGYSDPVFEQVVTSTSTEMFDDTRAVVVRLLRRFMRGMGAQAALQYSHPREIGHSIR